MANNIVNILPPSCIRLCVEPVQVELENGDNSLLFSALQSAFPNSTGIYFRPTRANSANAADCCRVMLKFDGRRFLPPAGGWNGTIDYFVELSGSRHTSFPFGSYEQASRQFERSVNLVQQMMNGSGVGMKPKNWRAADANGPRKGNMDHQELRLPSPQQSVRNLEQSDELDGRQPQEKNYTQVELMTRELSARQLKSLERDFADLARICAGKDAVIDGQRAELDQSRLELDRLRAGQQEWADKEAEWKAKLESSQAELSMLRDLGRDQESLHGRIEELSQQLEAEQNAREGQRRQLELELHKCQREANEWKEKSELGTWTVSELTEQLKKAQREKADLQRKAAILEEQVNGEAMEFGRRFQERERVQQELLADNTRLYQIKDQLELQCRELGERLTGLEVQFAKRMDIFRMESEAKEEKLRENLLAADSRLLQMEMANRELAAAKAEAMEQLRRLRNPSAEDLGDQSQLFAYSQEG